MEIFTSVTIVKPLTKIRRERLLPQPGEITVRVGQEVSPIQIVARTAEETGFHILRASDVLGVRPEELNDYLLVEEGAALQRGMPIMRKPGMFGRATQYKSPVDGVLLQINNGCLILQQTPNLLELRAMMSGHVTSVLSSHGVVLETSGTLIQAVWGSGKEGHGKLTVVATAGGAMDESHVGAEVRGAVLVAGRVDRLEALLKAEENGMRGLIVGSMPAELCLRAHEFTFPIIITDGVGPQPMAEPIFQLLQQSEGREVSLFGGRESHKESRPEIIIPLPISSEVQAPSGLDQALAVGQTVRLLRRPYASQVGRVVALCAGVTGSPLAVRLPGVDVQLAGGETVSVPYTNLDLFV